jgi:DNA repair photolyase
VLTKAPWRGLDACDDLLGPEATLGVSLVWYPLYDTHAEMWEPGAETPTMRWAAMGRACTAGIPLWVSVEPVIVPSQALDLIHLLTLGVQNVRPQEIRVGKLNHLHLIPEDLRRRFAVDDIDWNAFALESHRLLYRWGGKYMLKAGLVERLPGNELREYNMRRGAGGCNGA